MKPFMDENFLLSTPTAEKLYHDFAAKQPILDYHCHINPKEIAQDRQFENITQVWLGGDHYKWRLMRACGVDERYITGDASDEEKFYKWATVLGKAIGNPLYHWSHLELKRYFNYDGILNEHTAKEVWELCNKKLAEPSMSVRSLIRQSNVKLICTTDDPIDSLEWHDFLAKDSSFAVKVLPTWRPDKAMNIEKPDYRDYLKKLSAASGVDIFSFETLKEALRKRMDFFASMGCTVSDHGLEHIMYEPVDEDAVEDIFTRRFSVKPISHLDELQFKTAFLQFAAEEYSKRGWVMQLHYGAKRDGNTIMYNKLGPDSGYDCINNHAPTSQTVEFFNALVMKDALPKTIIYSLDPNDNASIGTIIGCFQDSSVVSKIQHGSAWWFNDTKQGILDQLSSIANLGNLSGFVGMLTDSRSFLSYTRHEYFRRILCDYIGGLVENGEFPADMDTLSEIVTDISYHNAVRYFGFDL